MSALCPALQKFAGRGPPWGLNSVPLTDPNAEVALAAWELLLDCELSEMALIRMGWG